MKLFHDSQDVFYRNPFGAVAEGTEITLRIKVDNLNEGIQGVIFLSYKGGKREIPMKAHYTEGGEGYLEGIFKALGEPSLMRYYFKVVSHNGEIFYGNNYNCLGGIGEATRSTPNPYQITVYRQDFKTPDWLKDSVMYQIFVDRFFNGNQDGRISNTKANSLIHASWDDSPIYIKDRNGDILKWTFFGGNLKGVMEKLDYLRDLGINLIYLNPVFEAPSNHKYDTSDYHQIDSMFGDNRLFEELCRKAQENGINIILDGVFSHTGSDSIYFNKNERYPSKGAYQSTDSPYFPWYRFVEHPDNYDSWWGIKDLPNVNEMEPSYIDFVIKNKDSVLNFWMDKGIKGWRLDVVDELPGDFLKLFYKGLKGKDPDAILIGEVWEDASNKVSYEIEREYLQGNELDSVMNYPFRRILIDFFTYQRGFGELKGNIMSLFENYPLECFYSTMNFLSSHDVPRILTLLEGTPFDMELYKGSFPRINLSDSNNHILFQKLKLLYILQFTFPGVPSIYYGDEVGMLGHGDPYNRGTYPWNNMNRDLFKWVKDMIKLRRELDPLKTGSFLPIYFDNDIFSYYRIIKDGKDVFGNKGNSGIFLILINRSENREIKFKIENDFGAVYMLDILSNDDRCYFDEGKGNILVKPLEGKILTFRNGDI